MAPNFEFMYHFKPEDSSTASSAPDPSSASWARITWEHKKIPKNNIANFMILQKLNDKLGQAQWAMII